MFCSSDAERVLVESWAEDLYRLAGDPRLTNNGMGDIASALENISEEMLGSIMGDI